jgi:hypothetical protein
MQSFIEFKGKIFHGSNKTRLGTESSVNADTVDILREVADHLFRGHLKMYRKSIWKYIIS